MTKEEIIEGLDLSMNYIQLANGSIDSEEVTLMLNSLQGAIEFLITKQ